jgi:Tol biopolymer transport system component/DNA-binding winged helix-turn-helix (wHTH) protein
MTPERTGTFAFKGLIVDVRRQIVTRDGERIDLEPKAFRVLAHLIENRQRVVTKEELLASIWAGTFVTDNALTRVIAQIRKQLGDSARSPCFIETVATTGYRFIAIEEVTARPVLSVLPPAAPAQNPLLVPTSSHRWWITAAACVMAVAAAAWWIGRTRAPGTPHISGLQQLTSSAAADQFPCFSPDGSQIAFSSNRDGHFEIYVRSLAPGGAERQITADGGSNVEPAWSPNGQEIAYASQARGGIAVVPATGGITRYLTDTGSQPAWSPDGRSLVYTVGMTGRMSLWRVGLDGTPPRPVTHSGTPPGDHRYAKWLADGRHIVFSAFFPTKGQPWVADTMTGQLERLQIAADSVLFPSVSADRRFLYYSTPGRSGAAVPRDPLGVWRARVDSHWRADRPELLIPSGGQTQLDLAVSADGSRIAISQVRWESALWSLPLNRAGLADGDPKPIVRDGSVAISDPSFSPDGSRIAYASMRQGGDWTVFVAGSDGSGAYPITTSGHTISWFGNDSIGYIGSRDGQNSYWIAPLHGPPKLLNLKLDLGPYAVVKASRDGTRLVAHSGNRNVGIKLVLFDLGTGSSRDLTPPGRTLVFPSWSPDGRWIAAVERVDPNVDHRVVIDVATGAVQTLIDSPDNPSFFPSSWAPDSDRFVFPSLHDNVRNLSWVSRSTGRVEQLTHFHSQSEAAATPAWSPNGDRIVFQHIESAANIYVGELRY